MIDSHCNGPVRTSEAEMLDLADRWLHLINEGVMLTALNVNGLVRAENRRGLQPFGDLGVLYTTVDFLGNGLMD
jgi:hypothetical protein